LEYGLILVSSVITILKKYRIRLYIDRSSFHQSTTYEEWRTYMLNKKIAVFGSIIHTVYKIIYKLYMLYIILYKLYRLFIMYIKLYKL